MTIWLGRSAIAAAGLGLALGAGALVPAAADPVNAPMVRSFDLVCNDGRTYSIVLNGRGEWTPAHDTGSRRQFVPTSFDYFKGTTVNDAGEVIEEYDEPPLAKGSSGKKVRATRVSCVYTLSETYDDPALGELTFSGIGGVTGFFTPARR